MARKTVLVTGANGFIGNAAAKAFVAAGYTTYGLIRSSTSIPSLQRSEIIPILGTPDDLTWLPTLYSHSHTFDVIVSNTEDLLDYEPHFRNVLAMLLELARTSNKNGVRPFLIFASGCKDYGKGELHSETVKPFTESSPLRPNATLEPRCRLSQTVFSHSELFDAAIVRPTTLYGGSSSYYGAAFEVGMQAAELPAGKRVLRVAADPGSIVHGTHVADVGSAYVTLAEAPREKVSGQAWNISSAKYETAREVADAILASYQLDGVEFYEPDADYGKGRKGFDVVGLLFGYSQWVGSEKIRRELGWRDVRPGFTEGFEVYRKAYEVAARDGHDNVKRIRGFIDLWNGK